ncbi:MAG: HD domain-containing protein [Thermoanaerobaculia bacterium]|nr:HD domain-containing protein [Thermoanaerobaculia bacterium]
MRLRSLFFLLLFGLGVAPLAVASYWLVRENRDRLITEEKRYLTQSAQSLSREINGYLVGVRKQLHQVGVTLLTAPGSELPSERLREPWLGAYLHRFVVENPQLLALRVLTPSGEGPRLAPPDLPTELSVALDEAFEMARTERRPAWRFALSRISNEPVAALAVPVADEAGEVVFVVEVVARLRLMEAVFEREATASAAVFLVGEGGRLAWSEGADERSQLALARSQLLRDFARKPLLLAAEYAVETDDGRVQMLGLVSPVEETGWGVVVHRPTAAAFESADRMVASAAFVSLLVLATATALGLFVSRRIGVTVRRLTRTTHEIAEGSFGRRIPDNLFVHEFSQLATDFNRMSGHVEEHIERLKAAARVNRELFISSIRAFAAAIDAKDPYTRGHSERVAELARSIARHLGQNDDFQHRIWIGALLHDIGKIGVEDRILSKGGVLSPAEFEQMKQHPSVGAEILAPIEQLRDMIPVVRWHHENWNGRGYPDGLRGEEIPLSARIVAVADCYDAVTTDRPYQTAYEPRYAAEVITKLAGSRFDAKVVTAFLRAFELGDLVQQVGAGAAAGEIELPATANV